MTNKPWGEHDIMALCAVRYCLGRMTYIVSECQVWLYDVWPDLNEKTKNIIRRDIEEAFVRDDEDRLDGREVKALGHDCDRASWEKVRLLWSNK